MDARRHRSAPVIDHPLYWEPSLSYLKFAIWFSLLSTTAFVVVLALFAPEQIARARFVVWLFAIVAASGLLLRGGYRAAALWTLAAGAWLYIAATSWYVGGVDGTSVIILPVVITMLGWLVGPAAAVGAAVLSSLLMLGFAGAEMWGRMPAPPVTHPMLRWVIEVGVFVLTATLINTMVRSYRRRLAEVERLSGDLTRAQAVAHVGSWIYDLDLDHMQLSAETCRIFGVPAGTSGRRDSYLARTLPEDRAALDAEWQAALAGRSAFDHVHRIVVGPEIRWVRQTAEFEWAADGRAVRAVGTTQDITAAQRRAVEIVEARAQLQATLDAIPDLLFEVDLEGRFLDAHAGRAEGFFQPREWFLGRTVAEALPPLAASVAMASIREAHTSGRSLGGVIELSMPAGPRWFELSVSRKSATDAAGPPRFIVLSRDITDRQRATERLAITLEATQSVAWEFDVASGALTFDADAAARLNVADEVGAARTLTAWLDQLHPDDQAGLAAAVTAAFGPDNPVLDHEYRVPGRDGTWAWIHSRGRVAGRHADGSPQLAVGISSNITARKRMEEAHLRARKLQSLGTLAGGIAHDFNNVLGAIRGNVELAAEDVGPQHPASASLDEIRRASIRAAELVRRIMAFGTPQAAARQRVDLAGVVDEVLRLLRSTLPASIALRTEYAGATPSAFADASQVHEAIVNLTTNAAHAIGDTPGTITYRLDAVTVADERTAGLVPGRYARLAVIDTGCGIAPDALDRVFDAFYTTKPVGEGTGLGLSVVHGVMQSHGGAVTVASTLGRGTTITLFFPEAGPAPAIFETDRPARVAVPAGARRVLYLDDEGPLVDVAVRRLGRLGYDVTGFTDPEAALAAFRAAPERFDVVVTDLSMPGVGGFDVARRVLATKPGMPVIMATGWMRAEDEALARQIGVRELVLKPVGLEDLARMIDRWSDQGAAADEGEGP